MNAPTALRPSAHAALRGLIDYAGLFPPAKLPLAPALAEYDRSRRGPEAWMLGRFILPAARIAELEGALAAQRGGRRVGLSAIVDPGPDPRHWFDAVASSLSAVAAARGGQASVVEALEVALAPLAAQRETFDAPIGQLAALIARAGLDHLPAYAEIPRGPRWPELLDGAMAAAKRARLGVKVRCGGLTAEAFPSVAELAAFVEAAAAHGVAFKATAGLHHPVRHLDPATGLVMHGFLNLLAAAAFAGRVAHATLERILAEEDPAAFNFDETSFSWRAERIDVAQLAAARERTLVAYGSCSFSEPVEDLTALGILPAA